MGKLNLLIANASRYFTDSDIDVLQSAARQAEKFISDNFEFDYDVDVMITAPSFLLSAIPEDGISGYTYSSRLIALVIDKEQGPLREEIVFETMCHEMSHSMRWEKLPEYSKTMFDSMIFEGLAIALEEKAVADKAVESRQFFLTEIQQTSQETIDGMIEQLKDTFDSKDFDYNTVFYSGNDSLPRWAGYRLGYYFVKKHLEKNTDTLEELTVASYAKFSSQI